VYNIILFFMQYSKPEPEFIIFSSVSCQSLSKEVVKQDEEHLKLGEISWDKFEDGFPNIMIRKVEEVRGRDIIFLSSLLDQLDLFPQLSVIYTLPRYSVRSLMLVLPYFPTGTMERVEDEGQIATAATLARILSSTPLTISGPPKIVIFDIHALQERFYFSDNLIPCLCSAIPLLLEKLKSSHFGENVVIAFPDDGASKRFSKMFKDFPNVICSKIREGNQRIITIKDGKEYLNADSHVFIVDDLVKTGGTLLECKQALFTHGAGKVSAYVTHVIFPQQSWKKFSLNEDPKPFSVFYCTDSCPEVCEQIKNIKPFVIMSLAPLIRDAIIKF
jgi:ribose-phosphate pyrophosphokinase